MSEVKAVTTYAALLGAVFAQLRAAKGMKQGELAEAVGIGASTWSRIEKGESSLSTEQLMLAARALRVSPMKVFEIAEEASREAAKFGIAVELSARQAGSKGAAGSEEGNPLGAMFSGLTTAGVAKGLGFVIPVVGQLLGGLVGTIVARALTKESGDSPQKK